MSALNIHYSIEIDSELENLRSKHIQLTTEYEQLNLTKKDFETNELNIRKKNEELNRSKQAVLDRTRDEYEKLLGKYNDLDEVYRELVTLREKENCKLNKIVFLFFSERIFLIHIAESEIIRRELERLHNENIELTKQKETMNITHDIQIKKLHDNYSIKLRDVEQWPDRLQMELNHEREQHRIQINELERRLKENFTTVCEEFYLILKKCNFL